MVQERLTGSEAHRAQLCARSRRRNREEIIELLELKNEMYICTLDVFKLNVNIICHINQCHMYK